MTKINRVMVLVDVTQKGGTVVLRALHGWEQEVARVRHDYLREELAGKSADAAKMVALIKALKQLVIKLPQDQQADYELVIVQPSTNVQGWLDKSRLRKAEEIVELGGYLDRLLKRFKQVRLETRKREIILDLMEKGQAQHG